MNTKIVAFCAGLSCLNFLPALPAMSLLLQVLVGAALICFRFRSLVPLFLFIAGLSWGVFFSHQRLEHRLSPALEGVPLRVSGLVKSLPEKSDDQVSFLFKVNCLNTVATWAAQVELSKTECVRGPKVIRLSWYQTPPLDVEVGETWLLDVKLKRPHGFANPGGFDYEKWLFSQNIGASGYVINQGIHKRLPAGALDGFGPISSLFAWVDKWRQHIAQNMDTSTVSPEAKVFLRALTIGDQRGIQSAQYDILAQTGTTHLLAVSGLHVSLIAGFVYFISRLFLKWMPGLPQRSVAQKWAFVSSFIVGTFYCALAGFSLPTFRAWIILLCFSAYFLSEKQQNPWNSYFISLLLVCVLQPLAVLEASFWLSFIAVAVILALLTARVRQKKNPDRDEPVQVKKTTVYLHSTGRWLQADWRMQWGLFIGLLPLLLMLYGQLSLISPFFNMIAVPFVSWLVVPPALVAVLMLPLLPLDSNFMFYLAGQGIDLFWQIAQSLAAYPGLVMFLPGIDSTIATAGLILACVLCLLPKNFPGRWLGFFLILPALSEALIDSGVSETVSNVQSADAGRDQGDMDLTVMDVGQGLAVVFATQHHLLVYDTGSPFGPEMDAGAVVLAPFLRRSGFNRVDTLVLSHNDDDHTGGAKSLMRKFDVKELVAWPLTVQNLPQKAMSAVPRVHDCRTPQYWQWDSVHFLLFSWLSFGHELNSDNNSSCILKVWSENFSVLVPGDIEKTIEYSLVDDFRHWVQDEKYPFDLKAELLIAPHHGSASSSSQYFIDAVSPEQVIFSAAYRSRFHHPSPVVVKRYQRNEVRHFSTSESGALFYRLRSKKSGAETKNDFLSPQAYRQTHPRFWQTTDL